MGVYNGINRGVGARLARGHYTDDMHGLQIGLLNLINNKETLKILPIVNGRF